jgi:hypothetical protein
MEALSKQASRDQASLRHESASSSVHVPGMRGGRKSVSRERRRSPGGKTLLRFRCKSSSTE